MAPNTIIIQNNIVLLLVSSSFEVKRRFESTTSPVNVFNGLVEGVIVVEGVFDGEPKGCVEGRLEGELKGCAEGMSEGEPTGLEEGIVVGEEKEGKSVGINVKLGIFVGMTVGCRVGLFGLTGKSFG